MLDDQFPEVAAALRDTREDLLAFSAFPLEHWRKLWSTRPRLAPAAACTTRQTKRAPTSSGEWGSDVFGTADEVHTRRRGRRVADLMLERVGVVLVGDAEPRER